MRSRPINGSEGTSHKRKATRAVTRPNATFRVYETLPPLADDVVARKELRDFLRGRVRRVGTMHRIFSDRLRVHLADSAIRRLLRIGRAHHVAILCDRSLAFQHLHNDRPRGHELDELAEERPLAVHAVERLGLLARDPDTPLRNDAQACL